MKIDRRKTGWGLVVFLGGVLLLSGCAVLQPQEGDTATGSDDLLQPNVESAAAPAASQPAPLYYDFKDVLVPGELNLDREESFVYMTGGLTAGFLHLQGRVDAKSVVSFFENNMARDNWRQVSAFRSARTLLLFTKENRNCVIMITERRFSTGVDIWVAPTESGGAGGLLQ